MDESGERCSCSWLGESAAAAEFEFEWEFESGEWLLDVDFDEW